MADELTSRARPISAAHDDQYLVVSRGEAMRIRLADLCERGYGFDGAAAGSRLATGSSARIVRLPCVRTRRLAVVSLSKEFLAHRRHQTPRVGVRRHGAWRVIWPRRMWPRLRFCRRRHARPAEFFETRTGHSKIVSSPGAGHVSSVLSGACAGALTNTR